MSFFKNRNSGVITVMISLMLVAILSIGSLILEAGRLQSARTQLAEANISASTSTLSNYNKELFDRFNIYAFEDSEATQADYLEYLNYNSDLNSGYYGSNLTRLYSIKNCTVEGYYNLTYPSALKRQILANTRYYANSYKALINNDTYSAILFELADKCDYVSRFYEALSIDDVVQSMKTAAGSIENTMKVYYDYDESCTVTLDSAAVNNLPTKTGTVATPIPADELHELQNSRADAKSKLSGYSSSIGDVDLGTVNTETTIGFNGKEYSNARDAMKTFANDGKNIPLLKSNLLQAAGKISSVINNLASGSEAQNNFLVNNYISQKFSNRTYIANGYSGPVRGTTSAQSFSSACAEYIYGGNSSERENQSAAYWTIFYVRLIDNAYYFARNGSSNAANRLLWSYYETLIDMAMMTESRTVIPLTKTSVFMPMSMLGAVSSRFTSLTTVERALQSLGTLSNVTVDSSDYKSVSGKNYASYTDYISLSLWLVPNANKMLRLADLIQLEMRYRQTSDLGQSTDFLMSKQCTYCKATINAGFNSVLPVVSLNGEGNMNGLTFKSVKYVGY